MDLEVAQTVETIAEVKVESNRACCFVAIMLLSLVGCSVDRCNYSNGWAEDDEYIFNYTSTNDTTLFDLLVYVELERSYQYRNLNLELTVVDPRHKIYKDHVSIPFDSVTMYKKGQSEIVISNMKLKRGDYLFRVKEKMCDTLFGVKNFKMRLVPKWEKIK